MSSFFNKFITKSKYRFLLVFIIFMLVAVLFVNYVYYQKKGVTKCNQPFALCPAAKCSPDPINTNNAYCFCYVENGENYSYGNKTCDELAPYKGKNGEDFIYSTFSPIIASMGFEQIYCPSKGINLNCMNKKCSINPHNPKQAICDCSITNNNGEKWVTWNKKDTVSSCNYLSGGELEQHHIMSDFLKKQKTE